MQRRGSSIQKVDNADNTSSSRELEEIMQWKHKMVYHKKIVCLCIMNAPSFLKKNSKFYLLKIHDDLKKNVNT